MTFINLRTIICGQPAGTLTQDDAGRMSFSYDEDYDDIPLSLSLPIANRTYGQRVVSPYLFGLLPDDERQRRMIAAEHDVSPNNPVALLAHIGLDCPGAVQFCKPCDEESVLQRRGSYQTLSDHDIAQRLKALSRDSVGSWMGSEESWSLGGNQGKFALAYRDDSWNECHGSSPTTHIFKNGVRGYELQALNEYICMKVARLCGIAAAQVQYRLFEDEPALIVERYDRLLSPHGDVMRLHQEDLCQALSVPPSQKYTADGGPTTADVQKLLTGTGHATTNLNEFTKMLFFNYLIGAPDAHAKNYSLLLGRGGSAVLAPLYDVASGLAYSQLRTRGRMAMAIGGENRFGRVGSGAVRRYAGADKPKLQAVLEAAGLTEGVCLDLMAKLAQTIPSAVNTAFDNAQELPGAAELREHLACFIVQNCERTLTMLD